VETGDGDLVQERETRNNEKDDAAMLLDMEIKDGSVSISDPSPAGEQPITRPNRRRVQSAPVHVDLGSAAMVDVEEIGLWIMGSRGPNNEYVSCGGVRFG
jgi:hypothetical protein